MKLRTKLGIAALLLSSSTLTACTLSAAGGIVGGAGALAFAVFVLMGSVSQTGCKSREHEDRFLCLAPMDREVFDAGIGPCLKPEVVGDASRFDAAATPDANVGPCLDVDVRPCLDIGPCLSPPEAEPEMPVCLSVAPPGAQLERIEPTAPVREVPDRAHSIDKLASRLPADVVARLRGDE